MSNKAYTYYVNPHGSSQTGNPPIQSEDGSVHESSPTWVLTFVRFADRDTERIVDSDPLAVRGLLVVENDCIQVTTTDSKGTLTPSMNAVLKMTDVNYLAAVAPGDFVFVNMLNSEKRARDIANQARAYKPINGPNDGFKGVYKVQGVRRSETIIDPVSGAKALFFKINGFAFTEFNNTIYFNPYLLDPNQDTQNQLLFASFIGDDWASLVTAKGYSSVQDIVALLVQSFIGYGVKEQEFLNQKGMLNTPNVHFRIPKTVGTLLGIPKAKAAKDMYRYVFGIQQYAGGSGSNSTLSVGMNPLIDSNPWSGFYYTKTKCEGQTLLKPEYWNQIKTWSILNQYVNSPLNELYTCFRISPDNQVMPTLVMRQIPFTNDDFSKTLAINKVSSFNLETTKFMSLPRWKIHPSLVFERDIGRDEAARINFVQYFGRSSVGVDGADIAVENAAGNYVYDIKDVSRSGLRPYVVSTEFENPSAASKTYHSPQWAQIVGDAIMGGHLKLNGTITVAGIVAPICIGDNLELDNVVYHIEQISHTSGISPQDGKKMFRTTLALSHGTAIATSSAGLRYPDMYNTNAYQKRKEDWTVNQMLPGTSEAQDVVYRPGGRVEPSTVEITKPSSPFTQPGQTSTAGGDDNE